MTKDIELVGKVETNRLIDKEVIQLTSHKTCKSKHTYWSYKTAHKAAQRRNKSAGYKYLRAYKCNICYGWHLTTEVKL